MLIQQFAFNSFQENTYILFDDSKSCVIVDPGCNNDEERQVLSDFISMNKLSPVALLNTHCHIDHVLGNKFVSEEYNLKLQAHEGEQVVLDTCEMVASMYGIHYDKGPNIEVFLKPGTKFSFGNTSLDILFTPGHSPASVSLHDEASKILVAGDVLFSGSIGRTDLPGGDFETLIHSIKTQFFPLSNDTVVYSGHGPSTTIEKEKKTNPFLR